MSTLPRLDLILGNKPLLSILPSTRPSSSPDTPSKFGYSVNLDTKSGAEKGVLFVKRKREKYEKYRAFVVIRVGTSERSRVSLCVFREDSDSSAAGRKRKVSEGVRKGELFCDPFDCFEQKWRMIDNRPLPSRYCFV